VSEELSTAEPPSRSEHTPLLTILIGDRAETRALPPAASWLIGRSERAEVRIDEQSVSREHAKLSIERGRFSIEDLGSANGTIVHGARIAARQAVEVLPESPFSIGEALLIVRYAQLAKKPRRLFPHAHFEARLDELCRSSKTVSILLVDVERGDTDADLEEPLVVSLGPRDLVASYAPRRFELLFEDTEGDRARVIGDRLTRMLGQRGLTAKVAVASAPVDGHGAEVLWSRAIARLHGAEATDGELLSPGGELSRMIDRLARGELAVLLAGETGVGKEVVARLIHQASPRRDRAFVRIDSSALSLRELENKVNEGIGSTVFFDEIGELSLELQAKLARFVDSLPPSGVRFISATHHDLAAAVESAAFRQDLFFRLNGITLVVPPLRERIDELRPLADLFLAKMSRELGCEAPAITEAAYEMLEQYPWPGNIRELKNIIERGVLLADGEDLRPEHLPLDKLLARWVVPASEEEDPERDRILRVLDECAGNQSRAARSLGISRGALLNKLNRYGVPRPRARK
jgi:two-component system, NtrC family, response regulator AtoC